MKKVYIRQFYVAFSKRKVMFSNPIKWWFIFSYHKPFGIRQIVIGMFGVILHFNWDKKLV